MFVTSCKKRHIFAIFRSNFKTKGYNLDLQELTGRHEIKEVRDRAGKILQDHGTCLSSQN